MPSGIVPPWAVTHLAANLKAPSNRSVLRPRRQYDARELRVRRTIAAPARDLCDGAKDHALTASGGKRNTITSLNPRLVRASYPADTACPYRLCTEPHKAEEGFNHIQEPFAGCDLHPYAGVPVARIPPVVPYAGLDDGRLASTKIADLPVALHGQLTLEHGELFDKKRDGGVPPPHATQRAPLIRRSRGLPGCPRDAQDRGAFPGDGVLPDFGRLLSVCDLAGHAGRGANPYLSTYAFSFLLCLYYCQF